MPAKANLLLKRFSILVSLVSILVLMRSLPLDLLKGQLSNWIAGLGFWGPVVFAFIYILATVLLIPGSVLTLAAGAIFGLWTGFVVVSFSSVAGAALAFLIARYLARRKVEQMAASNPKFSAIDQAITEGGWKIVAMLRLSPAIPFNLQNYLYGLTNIKTGPYVLTSWIAMMPGTLMYVYLGHFAGAATVGGSKSPGEWALLIVGLLATIAVSVYITKLAKKKLQAQTELEGPQSQGKDTNLEELAPFPARTIIVSVLLVVIAASAQFNKENIANWLERLLS